MSARPRQRETRHSDGRPARSPNAGALLQRRQARLQELRLKRTNDTSEQARSRARGFLCYATVEQIQVQRTKLEGGARDVRETLDGQTPEQKKSVATRCDLPH